MKMKNWNDLYIFRNVKCKQNNAWNHESIATHESKFLTLRSGRFALGEEG
jgi:hypothetical protein